MKNNTLRSLSVLFLALILGAFAVSAAPTQIPTTTLSAAVDAKQPYVFLASVTSVTGPSQPVSNGSLGTPTGASWTILYIDSEAIRVTTSPGTSSAPVYVERGWQGTGAQAHAKSALVWVATPAMFVYDVASLPAGACTRANLSYTPVINLRGGTIFDCVGGQWTVGVGAMTAYRTEFPALGETAYTGLNTNGTAVGSTTLYCTEVNLPGSKLLTGIALLNGTTVTANARYVILYDSTGVALANSALAGQASVTASVFETYAFTSQFYAVGPAQYFACLQDNSTGSTTVRMLVTGVHDNTLTKGQTSAVFGTVPVLVPPTTFTTAVGPYVFLY